MAALPVEEALDAARRLLAGETVPAAPVPAGFGAG
jgi:hypothetical protein